MKSISRLLRTAFEIRFLAAVLIAIAIAAVATGVPIGIMVFTHDIPIVLLSWPIVGIVIGVAMLYGAIRVLLYHPVFDSDYSKWLATTPWEPELPLPKGPIHLVWGDGVIVAVLCGLSTLLSFSIPEDAWLYAIGPALSFAAAIAITWTLANLATGQTAHVWCALFAPCLLGLLGLPVSGIIFCPFVVAAIAWHGVHHSLKRFPWGNTTASKLWEDKSQALIGWPYRNLLLQSGDFHVNFRRAVLESSLAAGWAWYWIESMRKSDSQGDLDAEMVAVGFGTLAIVGVRLGGYGAAICSHLCWGQRVANRQWIVPRHDQIFLVPILMVVVGSVVPWALHIGLGVSVAVSCGIGLGLVVLLGRGVGPSVRELELTGVHSRFGALDQSKRFITASGSNS
ncbi:MAG: hypothetical protein KDA57_15605 [Planctomycetales bacterium]|nr:hypothetical protein [Planctomycetales bacterium]